MVVRTQATKNGSSQLTRSLVNEAQMQDFCVVSPAINGRPKTLSRQRPVNGAAWMAFPFGRYLRVDDIAVWTTLP